MGSPAEKPAEDEAQQLQRELAEFSRRFEGVLAFDGFVDLDIIVGGSVTFRVTDVRGQVQQIEIPNDLPFPVASAFLNAWDEWYTAWERLMGAAGTRREKQLGAAYTRSHDRLSAALLVIVRLRQLAPDEFLEQFGEGALRQWINTLYARLTAIRAGAIFTAEDGAAGAPPDPKAGSPRTPTGRRTSSRSSAASGARTAGATTTGGRSAGRNSGPRSKKRATKRSVKR